MRTCVLFATLLLAFVYNSQALTYASTWGVYQGCAAGCCCPSKNSLIKIEKSGKEKMTLTIKKGEWSGCEDYGWDNSHKLTLPWDDSTSIDIQAGVDTIYKDKQGNNVQWTWYPVISEAQEDAEGIKKGDPIAALTSRQGITSGCQFIIGGPILRVFISMIMIIIIAVLFYI